MYGFCCISNELQSKPVTFFSFFLARRRCSPLLGGVHTSSSQFVVFSPSRHIPPCLDSRSTPSPAHPGFSPGAGPTRLYRPAVTGRLGLRHLSLLPNRVIALFCLSHFSFFLCAFFRPSVFLWRCLFENPNSPLSVGDASRGSFPQLQLWPRGFFPLLLFLVF